MRRRRVHATASLGGRRIAESDAAVIVEGTAYFPVADVDENALSRSRFKTLCYWKGVASYYDVQSDAGVAKRSAWTYRHPSPIARVVKDRVAFWYDVDVRVDR